MFVKKFMEDETTGLAAQLAYYFLLSLFPLLLFILTLLPYFNLPVHQVVEVIRMYAPGDTGQIIADNITSLLSETRGGLLSIGIIGTLWTASRGVNAFIRATNRAYGVEEERSFLNVNLLSMVLTFSMVFVVALTLFLPVFGQAIMNVIQSFIPLPDQLEFLYQLLRWVVAVGIMVFVLMMLYRAAPNASFKMRDVFWGAVTATVGWQLISVGFSFYVTNFGDYEATYGAIGGIIVLMIWFYLTGIILIIGGQINAVLYNWKNE
ncbi:YihY/virulence factor BrkB family protein [Salicibibacter kimchii]|uniref:YihY/virulence factor BrkB family protein n=1 Tax=Salicibibacter kimchii TaxID=2099786 RepID=A0A345C446_9BACI|nr:YihY/virulence factor BrkB family protein [Salicibibacter kimchii]AXF57977.1 YihY/virulence factor BrkB family protein [Salicibibacter kimchii]